MINTSYLRQLGAKYRATGQARRRLSELASQAQHLAKQAIFIIQRGELASGASLLKQSEDILKQGRSLFRKVEEIESIGSWRAALEEYAEAKLFLTYLKTSKVEKITSFAIPLEVYIGALSDFVGELVRYAVMLATEGKVEEVRKLVKVSTIIVGELAAMNLTGNLRSKFDQSKQHLRKLEDIQYDLSIKRHG